MHLCSTYAKRARATLDIALYLLPVVDLALNTTFHPISCVDGNTRASKSVCHAVAKPRRGPPRRLKFRQIPQALKHAAQAA